MSYNAFIEAAQNYMDSVKASDNSLELTKSNGYQKARKIISFHQFMKQQQKRCERGFMTVADYERSIKTKKAYIATQYKAWATKHAAK